MPLTICSVNLYLGLVSQGLLGMYYDHPLAILHCLFLRWDHLQRRFQGNTGSILFLRVQGTIRTAITTAYMVPSFRVLCLMTQPELSPKTGTNTGIKWCVVSCQCGFWIYKCLYCRKVWYFLQCNPFKSLFWLIMVCLFSRCPSGSWMKKLHFPTHRWRSPSRASLDPVSLSLTPDLFFSC